MKRQDLGESPAPVASAELPWRLPRTARGPGASSRPALQRLADYGWRASTGPLVWNRHKSQLCAEPGAGWVPIPWATDLDEGTVHPNLSRDSRRFLAPKDRDLFMLLPEPAVVVQRTAAPEQPRRLLAAVPAETTIASWGGGVVVENHVNMLRWLDLDSPLTAPAPAALLDSQALDRLVKWDEVV